MIKIFVMAIAFLGLIGIMGQADEPKKTAYVRCWVGKSFYSANGIFDPKEFTLIESGTGDKMYLPREFCLIRGNHGARL